MTAATALRMVATLEPHELEQHGRRDGTDRCLEEVLDCMTRAHASESTVSEMGQVVQHSTEAALLQRLRDGHDEAFGELYELHVGAVRRLARGLSTDGSEADDITAETFFRVLQALRRGFGPRDSARAYLLTVARRVCWEWHAARREVPIPDDELTNRIGSTYDRHSSAAEHALIAHAFAGLPERWRVVLWQTEVEGVQPAMVAPHFGLSANATAALARRARLGLRAAYLQAHIAMQQSPDHCRGVLDKLGGYTAGVVTGTQARKVRTHLRRCPTCRATHGQLRDVSTSLRAHAGALAVLIPASGLALASGGSGAAGSATGTALVALGTKLKVGVAVASTTAAGAVAAAPVVIDPDATRPIGLPGSVTELTLAPSTPPEQEQPPVSSDPTEATSPQRAGSPPTVALSPTRRSQARTYNVPNAASGHAADRELTETAPSTKEAQPTSTGRQPRIDTAKPTHSTIPTTSSSTPPSSTTTTTSSPAQTTSTTTGTSTSRTSTETSTSATTSTEGRTPDGDTDDERTGGDSATETTTPSPERSSS